MEPFPITSHPLYNRERLLILCDFLPEVPGNSGGVLAHGLEDVTGHVHEVDAWRTQDGVRVRERLQPAAAWRIRAHLR